MGPKEWTLKFRSVLPMLIDMRNYRKIAAWKRADDLAVVVYNLTRGFPREELYGLISQLRRAAYSVAANICEGAARESKRDYLHFLQIARASLAEVDYFVHLSHRLGFLSDESVDPLRGQINETFACLTGLIKAVKKEAERDHRTMGQ